MLLINQLRHGTCKYVRLTKYALLISLLIGTPIGYRVKLISSSPYAHVINIIVHEAHIEKEKIGGFSFLNITSLDNLVQSVAIFRFAVNCAV